MDLKAIVLAGSVLTAVIGAASAPAYAAHPQPGNDQQNAGRSAGTDDDKGSGLGGVRPVKGADQSADSARAKRVSATSSDEFGLEGLRQKRSRVSPDFNPFRQKGAKISSLDDED
jgi:hypothetical protein